MSRSVSTRQLLSKARDGCVGSLRALHILSLKSEFCTDELVEVALKHLQPDLLPSQASHQLPERTQLEEDIERARLCVLIIAQVSKACPSRKLLRQSLISRIIHSAQGFCLWNELLFDRTISSSTRATTRIGDIRKAYFQQATLLLDLIVIDKQILTAFASERAFCRLIHHLWVGKDSHGDVIMALKGTENDRDGSGRDEQDECPILECMRVALEHETDREQFAEFIMSVGQHARRRFTSAMVGRLQQLTRQNPPYAEAYIQNLDSLRWITAYIIDCDVGLHRLLRKKRYVIQFGIALARLFDFVSLPQQSQILHSFVRHHIPFIDHLLRIKMTSPSHVARSCHDFLVSGLLLLLVKQMQHASPDDEVLKRSFHSVIGDLGRYMFYPLVLEQLKALAYTPDTQEELQNNPQVAGLWRNFKIMIGVAGGAYPNLRPVDVALCDDPSCNRKAFGGQKQCSGCSSVIYCSPTCQRRDWEERHRFECRFSRTVHHARRSAGTWCSHTTRAYYAKLLAIFWAHHHQVIEADCKQRYPNVPFNHLLPRFDFIMTGNTKGVKELKPIDSFKSPNEDWWNDVGLDGRAVHCPHVWLKPRLSQLLENYRTSGTQQGMRVIQGSFLWGDKFMIFLTVRVRNDDTGTFNADYCVARYAEVPLGGGLPGEVMEKE